MTTIPGLLIAHPQTGYRSLRTFENEFSRGLMLILLSSQPSLILTPVELEDDDEDYARVARGYAGVDGQDLPQSGNEVVRESHFGTTER